MEISMDALRKAPILLRVAIAIGVVAALDSSAFLIWRWDKPLNNPGGPIGGMGTKYILWEISTTTLWGISMLCGCVQQGLSLAKRELAAAAHERSKV